MADGKVLVLAVAYESENEVLRMSADISESGCSEIDLIVVDNSPRLSPRLEELRGSNTRLMHFSDNPGFCGGARRALSVLAGERVAPLPYRAVVLANTDLQVDWRQVLVVVKDAVVAHGGSNWILAPDIVEEGLRYRANPAGFTATESRRRQRALRSSRIAFSLYWWLSQQKRARQVNRHADAPRWTPMYRPYGAFVIFGAGFFANGGVIHDGPLFNEEEAFARIAQHIGTPVLYEPELRVDHQAGVTYKHRSDAYRKRYQWHREAEAFYSGWHPRHVVGTMKTWFVEDPPLGDR